ncbi:Mediator complex subunit Med20 [Penicillium hispanicum]|uniref:Mediator complex subunit Med20 n=1 Tax=Penicillium hispanicum TaxID=1080232 RepID=UPI0025417986|nr:Mediator complex subunit Med20 [Penicillium hispanicum]KAJ5584227.1 Mediator complex subunit Med20 [Penicillium hispanicum]
MPITGVYFIPSHANASTALATVIERLRATFPDEDLIPIGRWALEQKLMRDTQGLLPQSTAPGQRPSKPRYMQFLSLTHHPTHGFIYTSEPTAAPNPTSMTPPAASTPTSQTPASDEPPMLMTTLPPASLASLFQHFTYACQPFWCHRLTVAVPSGAVYEVGDFRVRAGDVRQTFPTARVRGTVVEIEWRGPSVVDALAAAEGGAAREHDADAGVDAAFASLEAADVDAEYAATAALIREFWGRVGVDGAREAILVPGVGTEVKERLQRYRSGKGRPGSGEAPWDEGGLGVGLGSVAVEEDPDPQAGTDLARQYMEVLRFNR